MRSILTTDILMIWEQDYLIAGIYEINNMEFV